MQHANLTLQTPNKRKLFPINVNQPVYIQYQVHPFETGAQHHRMTPIEHFLTDSMQTSFTD